MDKLTYIVKVMQVPPGHRVVTHGALLGNRFPRTFGSGECAAAWAEAYPDKVEDIVTVAFVTEWPRSEDKCWYCSLEVCNDVERSVAEALGGFPETPP